MGPDCESFAPRCTIRRMTAVCILLCLLMQTPNLSTGLTSQVDATRVMADPDEEAQRQSAIRDAAMAKQAAPQRLQDFLDFGQRDGFLTLAYRHPQSHLEFTSQPIIGWDGPCTSRAAHLRPGDVAVNVEHWTFDPPTTSIHTHLLSTVNHVQIAIAQTVGNEQTQFSIVQNVRNEFNSEVPSDVVFRLKRIIVSPDDQSETSLENIELTAPTFDQLALEHGSQLKPWLGDVFARLGQPMLFQGGEKVAKQVLTMNRESVERMIVTVRALLPELDSPDAAVRKTAHEKLKALGTAAQSAMRRLDFDSLSPEQQQTIEELTADFVDVDDAAVDELRADQDYLLDVMNSRDADLRTLAAARLKDLSKGAIDIAPGLDSAARFHAVAEARKTRQGPSPTTLPNTQRTQ